MKTLYDRVPGRNIEASEGRLTDQLFSRSIPSLGGYQAPQDSELVWPNNIAGSAVAVSHFVATVVAPFVIAASPEKT